jgi:hypothetical protein
MASAKDLERATRSLSFLEFLDRWGERRSKRDPLLHIDTKTLIGFGFLLGYYVLIFRFSLAAVPVENAGIIRDAMLVLGPPVGMIVGAIFRETAADAAARASSGAALRTLAANAGTGDGTTANTTGGNT